ncbi:MAG TPA: SGNH/GDSL hydrolase family protein [Planctomycetota bacterium]|nr:SGNH/GDSL hydrolase family protein [Planctomycetota bacterium]
MSRAPLWRKLLLSLAALALLAVAGEIAGRLWLAFHAPLPPPPSLTEQVHCAYDEQLGWRNMPSVARPDIYGKGLSLTTNARGFRALEEYAPDPPAGRFRIVCLGDSFTMGYGVDDHDTYPARLQQLCPTVQAVNMGLGGYGLDQDYLWYLSDGVALKTDVLLFAFIDADFNRLAMDQFGGFPKPRADLDGEQLVVRNVPVPRVFTTRDLQPTAWTTFVEGLALWKLSRPVFARVLPAGRTEEQLLATFAVAGRLFDELARLSAERGQAFVMAYLPTSTLAGQPPTRFALWARDHAAARHVPFVDMGAAFAGLPATDLPRHFLPDRHFSATGAGFVARTLLAELHRLLPAFPACPG